MEENNNNNNNPVSLLPPPPPQILAVQIPSYKTQINGRLPPDSLLQIWAHLPLKSLYKYRSVCKLWNHKISTDPLLSSLIHTLNNYNNTPTSTPLSLLLTLTHTQTEPVKIPDRPVHLSSTPLHVTLSQSTSNLYPIKNGFTPYVDHTLSLLPSSHVGPIICFSTNASFYLTNPSTHEFLTIPRGQNSLSKFSSLGYLPSKNKYILAKQNNNNIIEFLEFGPGQAGTAEWRATLTCTHVARDYGIFINNTFFWRVEKNNVASGNDYNCGVVFAWALDAEGRREREIGRPEGNEGETILYDKIYLVEYKGSLCAVDNFSKPPRTMIWVLNESDEWVRKFNIHISGMDRDVVYPFCDDYCEGEMVLCNLTRGRLYCYCFKNKSVRQVYRPKQRSCDRVFAVYTPGLFPLEIVD